MAKQKSITGRLSTYMRDDELSGGRQPPAAFFRYSRDRTAEHPAWHLERSTGILQADACTEYNDLYHPARKPGPITEAACRAHGRRKLCKLAELARATIKAVRRIDGIFDIEPELNSLARELRHAGRLARVLPLVRGGERAAAMYSLIAKRKLNDIDPRAWLADALARIPDHPASRLKELLAWNWAPRRRHAERA